MSKAKSFRLSDNTISAIDALSKSSGLSQTKVVESAVDFLAILSGATKIHIETQTNGQFALTPERAAVFNAGNLTYLYLHTSGGIDTVLNK